MTLDCTTALEALRDTLATGAELEAEARLHLETCATCRSRLGTVMEALAEQGNPGLNPSRMESEVRHRFQRRQGLRGIALWILGLMLAVLAPLVLVGGGWLDRSAVSGVALLLGILLSGALALLLVRIPARLGLYKRLRKGRQLSGVCLGLAEHTPIPVWAWRLVFLLLTFFYGIGLWLYVLLDLAMPVHPEDRPNLLRYRIARWWRGLRTA